MTWDTGSLRMGRVATSHPIALCIFKKRVKLPCRKTNSIKNKSTDNLVSCLTPLSLRPSEQLDKYNFEPKP